MWLFANYPQHEEMKNVCTMTGPRRRDGRPQWIDDDLDSVKSLVRADLNGRSGSKFDEAWLQQLLHRRPEVFPIEQIEPGFGDLIPVCRELSVTFGAGRSGALDNLYVTVSGGLVLVEAKLWRNPEARRSVVAQAMEYAAAIFRMSYQEFEAAAIKARGADDRSANSLVEIVANHAEDLDEAEFIDAVTRNLRRGRAVIAVVGDGIREDILPLTELLQTHAGHRFTFALVELAVYDAPINGVRLVVPSVLAQTTLIERGVVHINEESGRLSIGAPIASVSLPAATPRRAVSIGEDEFYEILGQRDPTWPTLLRDFLGKAEKLGLYAERQAGLNLKHASPEGQPLNLGTISKDGFVETSPSTWWGRTDVGRKYNQTLAGAIAGSVGDIKQGTESALRTAAGRMPRLSDLLPAHGQAWLDAIQQYVRDMFDAAGDGKG
jgi:hypothetical protein